ncbi:hypothetical protein GCM10010399_03380 [Dactylosporangium fulvum]|uniref:Glutathionylspermidine synthase pre-ATP-grasp-like domain-containing protein n=1 Tax=Dactylosporangium fulvum TaxID=53359 RepID=A0ABY5VSU1_9ACTN|nr:hypothetical protein [Dactylosporangium fulvum]UWP79889.1 hypothetical protein Dfulv_32615 [Dactylosporangium fulvum]
MDDVTRTYLQQCRAGDSGLIGAAAAARQRLPERFALRWGEWMLPRPLFIEAAEMFGFADDLAALFHLMVSMPDRLFAGDLGGYCAAVGIDARRAALLSRLDGPPPLYGRADAYHDGTGLRVLEYNIGSELGGIDTAALAAAWLDVDAFTGFAERHRLAYEDTGRHLAQTLRSAAAELTGGADPVVALIEPDNGMNDYLAASLSFQDMLCGFGLETLLGEVSQLTERKGRLHLHGRPVDVVLRYFTEDEVIADPDGEQAIEPVIRAHQDGRVLLWTTLNSKLYASKGCLALLGDPRCRTALTVAERELVDRVLPWTRTLADGPAEVGAETVDLIDHCMQARSDLILKPSLGHSGAGIIAGWRVSDTVWKEALTDLVGSGYVVQQRVSPRPETMIDPDTGQPEVWHTTWSSFVMPDGFAGTSARTLMLDNDSQLRRVTPVFHHPAALL